MPRWHAVWKRRRPLMPGVVRPGRRARRCSKWAAAAPFLRAPVRRSRKPWVSVSMVPSVRPISIDLYPLADPGLLPALGMRGYRPTEFNNVLVKRVAAAEIVLTPRVRRALAGERDLWSHTVGSGFFDQHEL